MPPEYPALTSSDHPLIDAADTLRRQLRSFTFPAPAAYTYNPLEYAWESHCTYLERFGSGRKKAVFLGMNPGPWGMTQTGVPFGEISSVRDWMGISGPVGKPQLEHPKRQVVGFECQKSEVSGRRLWGLFQSLFGEADVFFKDHFVANFCPLVWMKETGANIVPDNLPRASMKPVEALCRAHLQKVITALQPDYLIGIGVFAEKQLQSVAQDHHRVGKILHPSPASPHANRDFAGTATRQLSELGLIS